MTKQETSKPKVKLEKWCIEKHPAGGWCLYGQVYDHPRFKDNTKVTTSTLEFLSHIDKNAETRNTKYILGEQSREVYEYFQNKNEEEMKHYDEMLKALANQLKDEGGKVFDAVGAEVKPDADHKPD